MKKPIRCTTHFHACDCREYEFEKVKRQLEIQTKRVENLRQMFSYGNPDNWQYYDSIKEGCDIPENSSTQWNAVFIPDEDDTTLLEGYGFPDREAYVTGKLARSCQAIDQELEKQLEEVK